VALVSQSDDREVRDAISQLKLHWWKYKKLTY